MCRLLFYRGITSNKLISLVDSIKKASEYDPLLEKASKGKRRSHGDGWGYVVYHEDSIIYYKSTTPIYEDSLGYNNLLHILTNLSNRNIILLIHTRTASEGSRNIVNTQPIKYSSLSTEFYLAHNGTVDKKEIARRLGFGNISREISDTYLMGYYMSLKLNTFTENLLLNLYRELAGYTKTAFNTMTLLLPASKNLESVVVVTNYYTTRDPQKIEYYRLYVEEKEDYVAYYSSTIHYLAKTRNASPLPNNTIHIIREPRRIHREKLL